MYMPLPPPFLPPSLFLPPPPLHAIASEPLCCARLARKQLYIKHTRTPTIHRWYFPHSTSYDYYFGRTKQESQREKREEVSNIGHGEGSWWWRRLGPEGHSESNELQTMICVWRR